MIEFFDMPQICDMGQTALLRFLPKDMLMIFFSQKSDGFGRERTRDPR
jgi:hypothetical protein